MSDRTILGTKDRARPSRRHLWLICGAVLALAGAVPVMVRADTKSGAEAWARGDYATAVAEWRSAAITGDADAQFNLGQAFALGRGVKQDEQQAMLWYGKAAAAGHPMAQDAYGLRLFAAGEREAAMPYIRQSAARGNVKAQYILGTATYNGDYVTRDTVRAYALMTRAAAAGFAPAIRRLQEFDTLMSPAEKQAGLALADQMEQQEQVARTTAATGRVAMTSGRGPATAAAPIAAPDSVAPTVAAPMPSARPDQMGTSYMPPPDQSATSLEDAVTQVPSSAPGLARPAPAIAPAPVAAAPVAAAPVMTPKPAAMPTPARAALPPRGAWRVQLGAFGERANAEILWDRLADHPTLTELDPYYVPGPKVTRLQAGPLRSRAEAQRICNALAPMGQVCVVVAP